MPGKFKQIEDLPTGKRVFVEDELGVVWAYDISTEEWDKIQRSIFEQQTRDARNSGFVEVTELEAKAMGTLLTEIK